MHSVTGAVSIIFTWCHSLLPFIFMAPGIISTAALAYPVVTEKVALDKMHNVRIVSWFYLGWQNEAIAWKQA